MYVCIYVCMYVYVFYGLLLCKTNFPTHPRDFQMWSSTLVSQTLNWEPYQLIITFSKPFGPNWKPTSLPMYVCVHACMHACVCVWSRRSGLDRGEVRELRQRRDEGVPFRVHVEARRDPGAAHTHMHMHMHMQMHMHMHMYMQMHMHMHTYIHICIYTYAYAYAYAYA